MKKFICVFVCLLMIMALICGCARSSEDDSGAENLSFDYDESNNSYIVIIYVDFSYSTFWSSSDCASLRDNIDTMSSSSQAVLGCDCLYMIYSRVDGVVYGSENGKDVTRALLLIEAGN